MYFGHNKNDGSDSREADWNRQISEFGFDETEIWSLGDTIVECSLFLIEKHSLPVSDNLKKGFELFVRDSGNRIWSEDENHSVNAALNEFGILFTFDEIRETLSEFILIRLESLLKTERDINVDSEEQREIFTEQYEKPIDVLKKVLGKKEDLTKEELETLNKIGTFLPGWWF